MRACVVPVHNFTNSQIFTKSGIDVYHAVSCQLQVTHPHFPMDNAQNSRREVTLSWRTGEPHVDSGRSSLKSETILVI
jgi:hypothetical protein